MLRLFSGQGRFWLILIILSLTAAGLVLVATADSGVGSSSDAANYVSVARNLLSGKGFVRYDDVPYTLWPPLYPMLLAIIASSGLSVPDAALMLNLLTIVLMVLLTGLMGLHLLGSKRWALAAAASIVLAVPFLECLTIAWADTLFALLMLAGLYLIVQFEVTPQSHMLCLAAAVTALACLQRYIGVTLGITGIYFLLFRLNDVNMVRRFRWAAIYGFITFVPLTVWMARNYLTNGTLTGPRLPVQFSFPLQMRSAADSLISWFLPSVIPTSLRLSLVSGVMVGLYLLFRRYRRLSTELIAGFQVRFASRIWSFTWIYLVMLLFQAWNTHLDQLSSSRYLLPVYAPVMLLVLFGVKSVCDLIARHYPGKDWISNAAFLLTALWLLYPAAWTVRRIEQTRREGTGFYNTTAWACSETLQWLESNPIPGRLISNIPEAIYVLKDKPCLKTAAWYDNETYIRNMLRSGEIGFLFWFDLIPVYGVYKPDQLAKWFDVESIAQLTDGSVYRLSSRDKPHSMAGKIQAVAEKLK